MQPMVIKIKFMPLIKQIKNSSTICCLEIVPNISSIENLEQINWSEKNDLIEYSVPVTYKVTLKKEQFKNNEKIYYSCIDLRNLNASSNLACGDVAQVISDNFILSKVEKEFFFSEPYNVVNRNMHKFPFDEFIISDFLEKTVTKPVENQQVPQEVISEIAETAELVSDLNEKGSKNKSNSREYALLKAKSYNNTAARSDTVKQKLTVTSICTFSTVDGLEVDTVNEGTIIKITNNMNIEKKRKIDCRESGFSPFSEMIFTKRIDEHQCKTFKKQCCDRILPDTRVAHFMMTVEKEILPLKLMLGEIYKKCSSLGLICKSSAFQTRNPHVTNKGMFVNKNKNKPKCNRVVYSIVFKG